MTPTGRRRTLVARSLPLLTLLVLAGAAVAPRVGDAAPEGCVSGCIAGTAADEFTADAAGLVREWIVQVPTATGADGIGHVVVGDGLVLVQSRDGQVHAIRSAAHSAAERPTGRAARLPDRQGSRASFGAGKAHRAGAIEAGRRRAGSPGAGHAADRPLPALHAASRDSTG